MPLSGSDNINREEMTQSVYLITPLEYIKYFLRESFVNMRVYRKQKYLNITEIIGLHGLIFLHYHIFRMLATFRYPVVGTSPQYSP